METDIGGFIRMARIVSSAMVETHTTTGTHERGTAMQRHFARDVDNNVNGARVVMSYSTEEVDVSAQTMAGMKEVVASANCFGAASVEVAGTYSCDDSLDVRVRFE